MSSLVKWVYNHKKGLAITGLIVGGIAYGVPYLIRRQLSVMQEQEEKHLSEKKKIKFFQGTQASCERCMSLFIPLLQTELNQIVTLPTKSELEEALKNCNVSEKLAFWDENIKVQTFVRLITGTYCIVLLSILCRLQVNLTGRYMYLDKTPSKGFDNVLNSNLFDYSSVENFEENLISEIEISANKNKNNNNNNNNNNEEEVEEEDNIFHLSEETKSNFLRATIQYFLNTGLQHLVNHVQKSIYSVLREVSISRKISKNDLVTIIHDIRKDVEQYTSINYFENNYMNFDERLINNDEKISVLTNFLLPYEEEYDFTNNRQSSNFNNPSFNDEFYDENQDFNQLIEDDESLFLLINETRNIFESEIFNDALTTSLNEAFHRLIKLLTDEYKDKESIALITLIPFVKKTTAKIFNQASLSFDQNGQPISNTNPIIDAIHTHSISDELAFQIFDVEEED
eukprot:TRINITY_DN3191_c0_g1_i1.p1 TRINITY_DN3191_c0_g1~~TRINITY_DN3191_c0_g1_i1.p1  ORF type:complete len:456 (-),score=126.14 TRINITY_DN3191_c0_g1_i1:201-1568(-)